MVFKKEVKPVTYLNQKLKRIFKEDILEIFCNALSITSSLLKCLNGINGPKVKVDLSKNAFKRYWTPPKMYFRHQICFVGDVKIWGFVDLYETEFKNR